jgi:DNA-binding NtrC family response regulator
MKELSNLKVLILDDERDFTEELAEFFTKSGFRSFQANTAESGLEILKNGEIDLLILDVRLPGADGLEILKQVKRTHPGLEVIIVSAHGDMDTVIRAMRLGAFDYLRKPFRHIDIQIAVQRTHKFLELQQRIRAMEERTSLISQSLSERIERHFIGVSPKILEVLDLAMTAAKFPDTHVLITGESGTGKENIARIIHFSSSRKDNLLCTVNSSSITESLMESEFFGHKKGSFTGAVADRKGFFEVSDQGTLFLDEIADMPLTLQAKVLRAIEEKKITRVGDTEPVFTDFRIISATNHNIDQLVEKKSFRIDLLHRLNTLQIHIPPLRERPEDIEPLVRFFLEDFCRKINHPVPAISGDVIPMLGLYDYPGNVRELKNMVERAVILARGDLLKREDFPFRTGSPLPPERGSGSRNLVEQERILIREALRDAGFNQSSAAQILGISRDALIRKMKKYRITVRKEGT